MMMRKKQLKALLVLKNKRIKYREQAQALSDLQHWQDKEYVENRCQTQEQFNKHKKDQIEFRHDEYVKYFNGIHLLNELIDEVEG